VEDLRTVATRPERLPALEADEPLRKAVEAGAAQYFTGISGYMKLALVNQLKADGLHPLASRVGAIQDSPR
jgi:hypothetical protein